MKAVHQQGCEQSRAVPERAIVTRFQTKLALAKLLPGQVSVLIDSKLQQQHM